MATEWHSQQDYIALAHANRMEVLKAHILRLQKAQRKGERVGKEQQEEQQQQHHLSSSSPRVFTASSWRAGAIMARRKKKAARPMVMRSKKPLSLVLLSLLTFFTLLAALEYRRGGGKGVWNWTGNTMLKNEDTEQQQELQQQAEQHRDKSSSKELLLVGGGGTAAVPAGSSGDGGAVAISDIRRRKRYLLVDAGKSILKVINLPLKHVLGGLRKLFLKVRRNKVEKYHQQEHGEEAAPETTRTTKKPRVATFVDLDQLTAEETAIVEEVYQELLTVAGLLERGEAVGMPIDRECVARYFIAAQWKPAVRGHVMVENIIRTVKWREDDRVDRLQVEDVAPQAWNGYLYVNGTDLNGRPIIYYQPAFQNNKRPDDAIQYLVYTLERALRASREESGAEAYSFIIDCKGINLHNVPPVHLIKKVFQMLHWHYPTRVGFIVFLNSGTAFQLLWRVLAPLVSPMTRNKIIFAGTGQEAKELLSRIGADQLELRYGGKNPFRFVPQDYFGVTWTAEEEVRYCKAA